MPVVRPRPHNEGHSPRNHGTQARVLSTSNSKGNQGFEKLRFPYTSRQGRQGSPQARPPTSPQRTERCAPFRGWAVSNGGLGVLLQTRTPPAVQGLCSGDGKQRGKGRTAGGGSLQRSTDARVCPARHLFQKPALGAYSKWLWDRRPGPAPWRQDAVGGRDAAGNSRT